MMQNLLLNPGFEENWGEQASHEVLICKPGQPPYISQLGNVFTPTSWLTWFKHVPGTWDQPEVRDAWATHDARRVHSGQKGILLFTFYRKHDAGFLQQVQVEPSTRLRLTAWAHAWSNADLEGHEDCKDNGRCSCGVGQDIVAIPANEIPPLNNDPWNDAIGNFLFCVGIDPIGGVDPYAATVKWGAPYAIYNGYAHQLEVETTAQASTVTVFLRSITLWPFKHNDAYWDDVELVVVEGDPPPPPPPEGRGQPRLQYERTYVLMPPDADAGRVLITTTATWNRCRYTIGGSADDAGIGDLDYRRVIAINPDRWPSDLGTFFDEYYPGVVYVPIQADNDYQLRGRLQALMLKDAGVKLAYPTTHLPPIVTDVFGRDRGDYFHNGLDLRSSWAVWGDEILSATDGEVVIAGWNDAEPWFGYQVRVKTILPDGREMLLRYAHFTQDGVYVAVGDQVRIGQKIGRPGSTGSSTADHLHLDVKVDGAYADPEMLIEFPEAESPPPPPPSFPLRGVHDLAGADWLEKEGLPGWCLVAAYLGTESRSLDLQQYADAGIRVLVNLRHSYAVDDGGQGTMPAPDKIIAFEHACAETMRCNPDAWAFVYCNEMNNPREHPGGFALTPEYYLNSYNRVWAEKPGGTRLFPGAIDPYNGGWGDWRESWSECLRLFTGADGIALHAYTHGPDLALIRSDQCFSHAPLVGVYYDLRVLESQQAIIPARFVGLPQVVTEANHWVKRDGSVGWEPDAGEWVREAYRYFAERGVSGVCLFRFNYDQWKFGDLPDVLDALR